MSPSGSSRRKFLVCGGDTRSFLAVVRSLGRSGAEIHAAFAPRFSAAFHSRFLTRIHYLPPYQPHEDRWLLALEQLLAAEKFDLIIPCTDNALLALRDVRTRLEKKTRLLMADEPVYQKFSDKIATFELAQQLQIPQPRSLVVDSPSQWQQALEELGLPVVVKPRSSVSSENPHSKMHVWQAHSVEELREGLKNVCPEQPLLLQQFVAGRGVGVEVLAERGEILFSFQHQRLHEPLLGGGSTYRRGMSLDPKLLGWASVLTKAVSLTGVAMFEFRVDKLNPEKFYFFEVNSRFWGSLPLAIASGADFPLFASQLVLDARREFPRTYRSGLYCRNLVLDLRWCFDNLLADHRDPYLLSESRVGAFAEWLNILKGIERSDTFTLDDLSPGFREVVSYGVRLITLAVSRFVKFLSFFPGVRDRARARARSKFSAAQSVIFVCKGNICRSPFAAAYTAQLFPEKRISSAGLLSQPGEKSPVFALEVAELFGAPLTDHRAMRLSSEAVASADLIVVFESRQKADLMGRYPECAEKVIVFEELQQGYAADVEDPFGGPRAGFQKCYHQVVSVIDQLRA